MPTAELNQLFIAAIYNGDLEQAKTCLEQGVDVRLSQDYALYGSINRANLPMIQLLTSYGVNLYDQNLPLYTAVEKGYVPTVRYLLRQGADFREDNCKALILAIQHGHLPVVQCLIHFGANLAMGLATAKSIGKHHIVQWLEYYQRSSQPVLPKNSTPLD